MRALIVGTGSIGSRHCRNLISIGVTRIALCDIDEERVSTLAAEVKAEQYFDYDEALFRFEPDIVFICTPPVSHVEQCKKAVVAGADVFLEKPTSHSLEGVDELIAEVDRRNSIVHVGYNLRYHKSACKLREFITDGAIGKTIWGHLEMGQYLPDWRPWQDYRRSYTAREELGGGIILDASHELDYACWLFGTPTAIACLAGNSGTLDTDVEDCATIVLRFGQGPQIDIHVDFLQRSYTRTYKLVGESGTIIWDYSSQEIRLFSAESGQWQTISCPCEPNAMYVDEVADFVDCVRKRQQPTIDLRQGKRVLELCLAAKRLATAGKQGMA